MARVAQYVTTRLAADYDNGVGHEPTLRQRNGPPSCEYGRSRRLPQSSTPRPRRHRRCAPASAWSSRSETRPATSAGCSSRSPKTSTKSSSSTATRPTSPSSPPADADPTSASYPKQGAGKGSALRTGFLAATGDIIVMMDADGSMSPQEIRHYLHFLTNGYDFVKGSRFISGGGSLDITPIPPTRQLVPAHRSSTPPTTPTSPTCATDSAPSTAATSTTSNSPPPALKSKPK